MHKKILSYKVSFLALGAFLLVICALFTQSASAQLTATTGYTATQMANKLAGPGVSVFGATLNCPLGASGEFVEVATPLNLDSGIVLTSGQVVTSGFTYGVDGPATDFASTSNGTGGDADLTALAGLATYDACVLEFDFKPSGDTVRFKYVFGSEEYSGFACSPYNDVFGFFITGGAFTTPTNLALVPGTTIPVCINSVNCGASPGYSLSTCTALGAGSPFCTYYVNNVAGTTVTYDGLTTVLTAEAIVSPCDTYHLKLGVADGSDHVYDSGVFIEAGSLTSRPPVLISGVGLSGLPYCVRGCADGTFSFSIPVAQDTAIVVHYNIVGTGVNGYDYSTLSGVDTIQPATTGNFVVLHPLLVPPTGPKTVTLEILIEDPCHPGSFTVGASSTLTILDSFTYDIVTPDTGICLGQFVHVIATGDTNFSSILNYTWSGPPTISSTGTLITNITPTVTGVFTYTLTMSTIAAVGCPDEHETITITVTSPNLSTYTHVNPSVCGYSDGSFTVGSFIPGDIDTIFYTKNGVVQPPVPAPVPSSGLLTISGLPAGVYSDIYVKVGGCLSNAVNITLVNPPKPTVAVSADTVRTCVGVPVQLYAYITVTPAGTPISYNWAPPLGLSSTTIYNPIVTPIAPGNVDYTVITSPDADVSCWDTGFIRVHTIGDFTLNTPDDTICLGQSINVSITGSDEISYSWSPTTGVVSATSKNPVITPTVPCVTTYTVTGTYAACPPYVHSFFTEVDTPAHTRNVVDTICLAMSDTFDVTVANSDNACNYYSYSWTPTTGMVTSTSSNPVITPTTTGTATYTVTITPHAAACAVDDHFTIFVLPNAITVSPTDTAVCKGAVVQAIGTGDPNFSYQWLPTTGIATSNVLNALIDADTSVDYVVTASFHRCPDMTATLHLDVQPNPTVYIGGNRFLCRYDTLHINSIVNPNWYPSYIYSWTPAAGLDNTNTATVVYSGTTSEMVYLTVTTSAGCTSNDSAFITVNNGPGTTIIPNMSFCPHDTAALTVSPATASYHWYPSVYLNDSMSGTPVISPVTSQTYTVVGTTAQGCKDTASFTATVLPAAIMFMPDSVTIFTGDSYNIEPTTNCNTFSWFPPAGLSSTIISNPVATPSISTKYLVTATTEWGCVTVDSITIIVDDGGIMAMPNAFTPGNGVNGEFKIINQGIASLNYFRIFNRWGNLVFETKNISDGWDGAFKGQPQPFGVYIYEVQAVSNAGKIITKQGNITLIR